jgi:hypothetical protein
MLLALVVLAAIADPQGTAATPPAPIAPAASEIEQRLAQSSALGRMLYHFDRAAWVSSDALTAKVPKEKLAGAGGYIVEQADAQTLRVTYYRGGAADAQAFFVADVRGGKVVQDSLLAQPIALTPEQASLARARQIAVKTAQARDYKPCGARPFNTVALPSRKGGPVAVYLLTPQEKAETYPMGGNYRVIVASDGKVLAHRPYSVSCLNLPAPKPEGDATPVGLVVTHLLDPTPTELHVFASYSLGVPVFVATRDKKIWKVSGSEISPASLK